MCCVGIPLDKVNTHSTLFNQKKVLWNLQLLTAHFIVAKKQTNEYNKKEGKCTW